jgi:hypothetical protein
MLGGLVGNVYFPPLIRLLVGFTNYEGTVLANFLLLLPTTQDIKHLFSINEMGYYGVQFPFAGRLRCHFHTRFH